MTALDTERPTDWRHLAACGQVDPEVFFPVGGTSFEAKRVCLSCPVRVECLTWAMDNPVDGIWGGTTLPERRDRARLNHRTYRPRNDEVAVREDQVREYHRLGYTDPEIATRMDMWPETIKRIRGRLQLPPNIVESPVPPRRRAAQ